MPHEDKDEKTHWSTFKGESKEEYRNFILRFEAYEDAKKIRATTSVDRVGDIPTDEQYWSQRKSNVVNGVATSVPLTKAEKKLYEENAKSRGKLLEYVDESLLESIVAAGGEKRSVYLMKEWLKLNYAEVTMADLLSELRKEKNELHPGNYKEALKYLGKLDSLNMKLGKLDTVGDKYKLDEIELKLEVLEKIVDDPCWE